VTVESDSYRFEKLWSSTDAEGPVDAAEGLEGALTAVIGSVICNDVGDYLCSVNLSFFCVLRLYPSFVKLCCGVVDLPPGIAQEGDLSPSGWMELPFRCLWTS
jgi:hypothetical protein